MLAAKGNFEVLAGSPFLLGGAGFGFRRKVHTGVALNHHGPIRVVSAQGRRGFELSGQLRKKTS